ncbi:hypothetical protein OG21DRAFT_1547443 [Imleria badia]|nr:hypothetical protein OG21DRAFT_1547443 [Imleria badia]
MISASFPSFHSAGTLYPRSELCIDGTSNQFEYNIVELYSHITKSAKQLTYYSSGLDAIAKVSGAHMGRQLSNNLDMAIGRNLRKVIMDSYRWLSDNYQDGDRIFLFGEIFRLMVLTFRVLVGMIARVGLLLPGNNEQVPFQPVTKESKKKAKYSELAKTFQKTFCRSNVHIHFVGLWDTVSLVGLSRSKTLPCTSA